MATRRAPVCGWALAGGLLLAACSGTGSAGTPPHPVTSTSAAVSTSAAAPAPGEDLVRSIVGNGAQADHFGWVYSSAKDVLATYYPPGSKAYVGGQHVDLTDQIIVIKMHGHFGHSGPPGAKTSATLWLTFYNATKEQRIGFVQMWDGDAPDLGVGYDPGIENREVAAGRWDLRLVGVPTVRTGSEARPS